MYLSRIISIILSAIILLFVQNMNGQKTKKSTIRKPKIVKVVKTVPITSVQESISEPMIVVEDYRERVVAPETSIDVVKGIADNTADGRYGVIKINQTCNWYFDKFKTDYSQKYGILKSGKSILPMLFSASTYSSVDAKLVILNIGTNYGLFNIETEKWEIPMIYSSMSLIGNQIYSVSINGKYGLINSKNEIIVPIKWNSIYAINDNTTYFFVTEPITYNKGIYSLLTDKLVIPCEYKEIDRIDSGSLFRVQNNSGFNIVTIDNKPKLKNWYEELNIINQRNNYIVKLNNKMGIIDSDEKIVLPIDYKLINRYAYNDGSFLSINSVGKYGCVTIDGKVTLPFEYDYLNNQYDTNLKSVKNNKCGLIQINNGLPTEIVTCNYDDITINRNSFVVQKNKKFGLIDSYGKVVIDCKYDSLKVVFLSQNYGQNDFMCIAQTGKNYTIISNKGEKINDATYSKIDVLKTISKTGYENNEKTNYLQFTDQNSKTGLLDLFGKEILTTSYDSILSETENNLIVKLKNKCGVYNLITKKEIIACEFDQIVFDNMIFYGVKANEIFSLDLNNSTITKF